MLLVHATLDIIITKIYLISGTTVSNIVLEKRRTNIVLKFTNYGHIYIVSAYLAFTLAVS